MTLRTKGVLAIDHGERKSGFAVADPLRIAVHPLPGLRVDGQGKGLLEHVASLLAERDVGTVLIGLPLHRDGSAGARAAEVRAFARRLAERFPRLAVRLWDEHLSTKEAEDRLRAAGYRGREIRERKDSWSALVLLLDWLEAGEPPGLEALDPV
jgi:putative Holliday junction resolvase